MNKIYQLETLTLSCVLKIEGAIKKIKGVNEVMTLINASKVRVEFDESILDRSEIRNTIEKLGFEVLWEK